MGKYKYYVTGLSYTGEFNLIDQDFEYGVYDTLEEAMDRFEEVKKMPEDEFFGECVECTDSIIIQIEKCEDYDDGIRCVDIVRDFVVFRNVEIGENGE